MRTITFVLIEQMLATSTVLPMEMWRCAQSHYRTHAKLPQLQLLTASIDGAPIKAHSGFRLTADVSIEQIATSDIVYLPALWRNPRPALRRSTKLFAWLRAQADTSAAISAVGTGACFLAATGLLNNKPATTHWHYFDQFAKDYPAVELKHQYFITRADNLFCAASVNALADLTVHLIKQFYGSSTANHVERNFSHEIRRPFEEISYSKGAVRLHPDEEVAQAQTWLKQHCGKAIRLSETARSFDMSMRSFNRRFKLATGQTPLQYLQNIRVEMARELLQSSNLSINEIAEKVGYQDMGHFTMLFKKKLSITPSAYRTTVRAKLFQVNT